MLRKKFDMFALRVKNGWIEKVEKTGLCHKFGNGRQSPVFQLLSNTSGKESRVLSKDLLSSVDRLGLIAFVNSVKVSGASAPGLSTVVQILGGSVWEGQFGRVSLGGSVWFVEIGAKSLTGKKFGTVLISCNFKGKIRWIHDSN